MDFRLLASLDVSRGIHGFNIGDFRLPRQEWIRSLLARRVKTTEHNKNQKIIRFLLNLAFTAVIVVSALDHRFAWSAVSALVVFFGDAARCARTPCSFFLCSRRIPLPPRPLKSKQGRKSYRQGRMRSCGIRCTSVASSSLRHPPCAQFMVGAAYGRVIYACNGVANSGRGKTARKGFGGLHGIPR